MVKAQKGLSLGFCLLLIMMGVGSISYAHPSHEETLFSPIDWQEGYTLILMSNVDNPSANQARDFVISRGGRIAIHSPPHIMLGWVSPELSAELIGKHGIELVTRDPVDLENLKYRDEQTLAAASFFNSVASKSLAQQMAAPSDVGGEPLINDALERPSIHYDHDLNNLQGVGVLPSPGTSDSMTGTVAVCLFFVESDGTIETNEYTWRDPILGDLAQNDMLSQAQSGLSWWASQAPAEAHLSFTLFYYPSTSPVNQQGYEPIRHPSTDDYLWINAIMANLGHTSGDKFARVDAFNTWLKGWAGTDRAYSAFIAINPWWLFAPDRFTNGYFAYAYKGGPYTQLLHNNDGHTTFGFGKVFAHETGHIFWACDEYYQAGYGGCTSCGACGGPRVVLNGNCEYCNSSAVDCMMRGNNYTLCPFTRSQIGWTSVDVGFASVPTGRLITVDGGTASQAPFSASWMPGIPHTIEAPSPQTEGSTRYVFSSWSDGGAQTHTVAPQGPASYTAYFTTQYQMVTSVSPPGWGTVDPPGTNWYDSGQDVTLRADPAVGYMFKRWSGDLNDTGNPVRIWMTGPKNITATFIQVPDLIEHSVSSPPAIALLGGSFSVTDTAENQGTLDSGPSTTQYYLSLDTMKNAGDILLGGSRSVPDLLLGATSTGTVTVTIPSSTAPGAYYLVACADDTNGVAESNENNNCFASSSTAKVIAFDLNFYDDYGRARLCVNSITGDWAYTILAGHGAGSTYTGGGSFTRKGNILWMNTMDAERWGLNLVYNDHLKKAMAAFGDKASGVRSSLVDADTTDNPLECN